MSKTKKGKTPEFDSSTPVSRHSGVELSGEETFVFDPAPAPIRKKLVELVQEAVEAVGVKRKGASYQAIKKFVEKTYEDNGGKFSLVLFKKAIAKGVDQGLLAKTSHSKDVKGVLGYYVIPKAAQENKNPKKLKASKMPVEESSDSEAMPKKVMKPKKLNLSDSAIHDLTVIARPRVCSIELALEQQGKKHGLKKVKLEKTLKLPGKKEDGKLPGKKEDGKLPGKKEVGKLPGKKEDRKLPGKKEDGKAAASKKKVMPKIPKGDGNISDSEIFVNNEKGRKSLKSYSSDTEVNDQNEKKQKRIKKKVVPEAKTNPKRKEKKDEEETTEVNAVVTRRKLYNKAEELKTKTLATGKPKAQVQKKKA